MTSIIYELLLLSRNKEAFHYSLVSISPLWYAFWRIIAELYMAGRQNQAQVEKDWVMSMRALLCYTNAVKTH